MKSVNNCKFEVIDECPYRNIHRLFSRNVFFVDKVLDDNNNGKIIKLNQIKSV